MTGIQRGLELQIGVSPGRQMRIGLFSGDERAILNRRPERTCGVLSVPADSYYGLSLTTKGTQMKALMFAFAAVLTIAVAAPSIANAEGLHDDHHHHHRHHSLLHKVLH